MESVRFANQHDLLPRVPGDNDPAASTAHEQLQPGSVRLTPQDATLQPVSSGCDNCPPSAQDPPPLAHQDHDLAARANVAAQTEIGSPRSRIPTRQDTQRQLAAVRESDLPVEASRTATQEGPSSSASDGATANSSSGGREQLRKNISELGDEMGSVAVPQQAHHYHHVESNDAVWSPHEQHRSNSWTITTPEPASKGNTGRINANPSMPPPLPSRVHYE